VIEPLGDGRQPLRTWGVALTAVDVLSTAGPFAKPLAGGSAAGPVYLLAGVAVVTVGLALRPAS